MAAKGTVAKQKIMDRLAVYFGSDFIGVQDNKMYIWTEENGERLQIALSMTCPKNWLDTAARPAEEDRSDWDFSDPTQPPAQVEITADEQKNLEEMMKRLGL